MNNLGVGRNVSELIRLMNGLNLSACGGTFLDGWPAQVLLSMFTVYRYAWPLRSGHGNQIQIPIRFNFKTYKLVLLIPSLTVGAWI